MKNYDDLAPEALQ